MRAGDWWTRGKAGQSEIEDVPRRIAPKVLRGRLEIYAFSFDDFSNLSKIWKILPMIKAFQRRSISIASGSSPTEATICDRNCLCLV